MGMYEYMRYVLSVLEVPVFAIQFQSEGPISRTKRSSPIPRSTFLVPHSSFLVLVLFYITYCLRANPEKGRLCIDLRLNRKRVWTVDTVNDAVKIIYGCYKHRRTRYTVCSKLANRTSHSHFVPLYFSHTILIMFMGVL